MTHIGLNDRPHKGSFTIQGTPTISPQVFGAWLTARKSPALNEADALAYYMASHKAGVNPGVALAFFHHESTCGTDPGGVVVRFNTKNWGNLRPRGSGAIGRASHKVDTPWGVFRVYNTFMDGLLDFLDLMNEVYAGMAIPTALQKYAPAADQNDPNTYANTVVMLLDKWDRESGEFDIPDGAAAPSTADFPLQAAPSISADVFTQALSNAGSPVLQQANGADYYNLCTANGVDPAVALAFFKQESNYGTAAGANDRKNWGNLWDKNTNAFGVYDTWIQSLRDWCTRLTTGAYTANGAPTIASVVPLYRGANNASNPQYLAGLAGTIEALRGGASRDLDLAGGTRDLDLAGGTRDLGPDQTGASGGLAAAGTPPPEGDNAVGPGLESAEMQLVSRGLESELGGLESGERGLGGQYGEWVGADASNYTTGRSGHQPIAIVNHVMIGTMAGTISVFQRAGWQASAHYGVGKDGRVVQFVDEGNTAWANGPLRDPNVGAMPWIGDAQQRGINPNSLSITIEWEGMHQGGTGGTVMFNGKPLEVSFMKGTITSFFVPTEEQYQAGLKLIQDIATRHNIPMDRAHIGRHSDVDSVYKWFCPGDGFPLQRILDDLSGGAAPQPAAATGDTSYSLQGPSTITPDAFAAALTSVNSPALQEAPAQTYYDLCVSKGVDPAVALGFFQQESNSGLATADQKNWGKTWDHNTNAVQVYGSWQEGLGDWCDRLTRSPYTDSGVPTVDSIIPTYRGAQADNPVYIAQLKARIDAARGATRELDLSGLVSSQVPVESVERGLESAPAPAPTKPRRPRTPKAGATPATASAEHGAASGEQAGEHETGKRRRSRRAHKADKDHKNHEGHR